MKFKSGKLGSKLFSLRGRGCLVIWFPLGGNITSGALETTVSGCEDHVASRHSEVDVVRLWDRDAHAGGRFRRGQVSSWDCTVEISGQLSYAKAPMFYFSCLNIIKTFTLL